MSGTNRKRGQEQKDAESPVVPDSTTKDRSFCNGDEVLMQRKDGNFYLGTVVEVDLVREQCLVKFGDNTDHWSTFKNLTKLNMRFEVMCVICKKSQSKKENEIIVCDRCARGYHQLCHQPSITTGTSCWQCLRCQGKPIKPLRAIRKAAPAPPPAPPPPPAPSNAEQQLRNKLPYDLYSLVWDLQHRVNTVQKYCYCGTPGEWFLKMLQCGRCRQWFHERCLSCLHFPLYFGDRFYVFVCSLCNNGKEFVRRFEMKWVDLVHLAIFNLTVHTAQKYHELDSDIISYVNANWDYLQLPPKIHNTSLDKRKNIILSVLTNNRNSPLKSGNNGILPPLPFGLGPFSEPPAGIKILHIDTRPLLLPKGMPATGHKVCIKSSFPCYPESRAQIERRIRAQGIENQRIRNFRARKARKLLKNAIATSQKLSQDLPPTPPSSVSAPDTPQPVALHSLPPVPTPTPGDTSGDDTSSSRTLDSFIPPPKDFEGKNNPFHSVSELLGGASSAGPSITLPLPLNPVITQPMLRPTKRRLSEKDIRIDRNGEVKRRRLRRQCTASKNAQVVPSASWNSAKTLRSMYNPTSSSSNNNSVDYTTVNGKKLRKSKQKASITTPTSSPIKQNPTISLDDLKTSVNIYFGAANRIAAGEKFTIRAKRITPQGRTQYLIAWGENPAT